MLCIVILSMLNVKLFSASAAVLERLEFFPKTREDVAKYPVPVSRR